MPGYHLPLFAAAVYGMWQRRGLYVDVVDPYPGPANARAAAMARYDACLTSVAHFLRAKTEDPELDARFVTMVAQDTHMTVFARRESGIRDFSGLAGATALGSPDKAFVREYEALLRHLQLERGPLVEVTRFIDERPEALRRLVGALREALEAADREPDRAIEAMRERIPDFDDSYTLRGLASGRPLVTPY